MASGDAVNVEKSNDYETETTDRSLLDFMKKDDQDESKVITTEFDDKIHVSKPEPELKPKSEDCKVEDEEKVTKPGLLQKLHRSGSKSSSSSDEEVEEGGEIKKKKKGLKEKIAEKIHKDEDTSVPVQVAEPEENKGLLDKIKDKLPVSGHKVEEETVAAPTPVEYDTVEGGKPVKKGLIEKIKDKLPGADHKVEGEKVSPPAAPQVDIYATEDGGEPAKKGIMDKIKEKMPGYQPKTTSTEEEKKQNDCA